MIWPPQNTGLFEVPPCVQCCGELLCEIECVSWEFDGQPGIETQILATSCPNREINVTASVLGNTLTTGGTIQNDGAAAVAVAGFRTTSTQEAGGLQACGFFSTGTAALGTIDMSGTSPFKWGVNLVYGALRDYYFGDPETEIDGRSEISTCQVPLVPSPVIGFPAGTAILGTECISFFDRDAYTDTDCDGSGTSEFLTDGTLHVRFVRARLKLSRLVVGTSYQATMVITRRLRGTEDPWELSSLEEYEFIATDSIEYTDYVQIGGTNSAYEFRAMLCTLEVKPPEPEECSFDPGSPYLQGFDQGAACEECDDGSGGCPGGAPGSDAQCWLDGYNEGLAGAVIDAGIDGYAQGTTCAPCDDGSGGCPGGTPCQDAWLEGYNEGFEDEGC